MDLTNDGTEAILGTFARYPAVLPNFHTLEAIFVSVQYPRPLHKTLNSINISKGGRELISWLSALIHTYIYLYNVAAFNAR